MPVKNVVAAIALVASLWPAPASAQTAGGYAIEYVEAHANWSAGRTRNGDTLFRFLSVWRDSEAAGGTDTIAQIGTVRCRSSEDRRTFLFSCKTNGRLVFLKDAEFEFDPTLRSASVGFEALGRKNQVTWIASDDRPKPDWRLEGGERSMAASAALTVTAKVRGRVLGERFSTKHRKARATLRRGVEGGAIYEVGLNTFTVGADSRAEARRSLRRRIDNL